MPSAYRALSRFALSLSLASLGACSASPPAPEPVGRATEPIVNGESSDASQNFVVLIVHPVSATEVYECTGTLLAPNLVMTARHCVSNTADVGFTCSTSGDGSDGGAIGADFAPSSLYVYTGLLRPATFALDHPSYVGAQIFHDDATNLCNHDVALIRLAQPITDMPIATLRLSPPPSPGDPITAVGWGAATSTNSPETRQQRSGISVLHVGPYNNPSTGEEVPDDEFDDGESICEGDSGSPALDAQGNVIGIASRGGNNKTPNQNDLALSCLGPETLNYYSRAGAFSSVILEAFQAAGATPKLAGGAPFGSFCADSSQCASNICLGSGSTGYCSETCGTCPTNYTCGAVSGQMVCQSDPGAGDSSGGGGCTVGAKGSGGGLFGVLLGLAGALSLRRRSARR